MDGLWGTAAILNMERVRGYRFVVHLAAFAGLGLPSLLMGYIWPQPETAFFCSDASIRHPFARPPLSRGTLYGLGYGCSALLVLLCEEFRLHVWERRHKRQSAVGVVWCNFDLWPGFLRFYYFWGWYVLGALLTVLICNVAKYGAGRLAPNFLAACEPFWPGVSCELMVEGRRWSAAISEHAEVHKGDVYQTARCYSDRDKAAAARSWPSLQAAFACYSAFYIVLYLDARVLCAMDRLLKVLVYLLPCLLAAGVCLGRVRAHFNHPSDVFCGAALGLAVAAIFAMYVGRFGGLPHYLSSCPESSEAVQRVDRGTDRVFWDFEPSVATSAGGTLPRDRSVSF